MEYEEEDFKQHNPASHKGKRAEEVAAWYFRLNGFFLIQGFIVHPDGLRPTPRTEADLLGIRLKESTEGIWRLDSRTSSRSSFKRLAMDDDRIIIETGKVGTVRRHLVAMVEVKAGICAINGPWSDRGMRESQPGMTNMERALGRVGFGNRSEITLAADTMYRDLRYEGDEFIVQYFAIGKHKSTALQQTYPRLVQISFDQVAEFLHDRFSKFPQKIPTDRNIEIWDGFGGWFRRWFEQIGYRHAPDVRACQQAVNNYIESEKSL